MYTGRAAAAAPRRAAASWQCGIIDWTGDNRRRAATRARPAQSIYRARARTLTMAAVGGCKMWLFCVTVCVLVAVISALTDSEARELLRRRQTTVDAEFADHPALQHIDARHCGTDSEAQISKGPLACGFPTVGDHPWLVALGYSSGLDEPVRYACSGVLVTDRMVVTSALCALGTTTMKLTTVRAGEYNLTSPRDCLWYEPDGCTRVQEVRVAGVRTHPKYSDAAYVDGAPSFYDLAVVQLRRNLTLQYGTRPICLPMFPLRMPPKAQFATSFSLVAPQTAAAAADDAAPPPDDATCCPCDRDRSATAGVMDHEKLIDADATYNGTAPCQYRLLRRPAAGGGPAGDRCLGAGHPCVADLGAPLVSPDRFGTHYYLLGVATTVPAAETCARTPGASVVYLPVRPHLGWILDSIDCLQSGDCDAP